MNTIEQAREVSVMLRSWRSAHSDGAADTVDALVAELVALKAQEPVAWMQSKPHEGDCIPGSEYLVMTDGWKKYLSKNPNNTDFVSSHDRPLYLEAGAQPYKDSTTALSVGDSSFESWFASYTSVSSSLKQLARDAYAAGMGDPLVVAAGAQPFDPDASYQEQLDATVGIDSVGAQSIPAGYQLVQVEPEEPNACEGDCDLGAEYCMLGCSKVLAHKAMLAAAPVQAGAQPAPKQEPVGVFRLYEGSYDHMAESYCHDDAVLLYAAPVQAQERKPLTDEQITEVWRELRAQKEDWSDLDFARAIEAYIKEQP